MVFTPIAGREAACLAHISHQTEHNGSAMRPDAPKGLGGPGAKEVLSEPRARLRWTIPYNLKWKHHKRTCRGRASPFLPFRSPLRYLPRPRLTPPSPPFPSPAHACRGAPCHARGFTGVRRIPRAGACQVGRVRRGDRQAAQRADCAHRRTKPAVRAAGAAALAPTCADACEGKGKKIAICHLQEGGLATSHPVPYC